MFLKTRTPSGVKRWTFDGLRAPVEDLGAARQGILKLLHSSLFIYLPLYGELYTA